MTVDFYLNDQGTIVVLYPATDVAERWIDEYLPDDSIVWCGGVVIEHRFVRDIVVGLVEDGLTIAEGIHVRGVRS